MNKVTDNPPVVLGKTFYCVRYYFNTYLKAFDGNVECAMKSLLQRKDISFDTPLPSFNEMKREKAVSWSVHFSDANRMDQVLLELNSLKDLHRLVSLAAVLEKLLLCGITFHKNAMVYDTPCCNSILSRANTFRKHCKFCDLTVKIGNDIIQANKTILAASSDYFAQCLNDTSTFLEITSENVDTLLKAAVTFELPKLQHLCKIYINFAKASNQFPLKNFDPTIKNNVMMQDDAEIINAPLPIVQFTRRAERKAKTAAYATIEAFEKQNEDFNVIGNAAATKKLTSKDPEYSIDDEDFDESDPHLLQQNEFSDESNFVCPTCGATFSQRLTYSLHLLCHDDEPVFQCLHCGQAETSADTLKVHMQENHAKTEDNSTERSLDDETKPACNICLRTFSNLRNLSVHLKTHQKAATNEKASTNRPKIHPCTVCKKTFRSKSHLGRHMISHTGERKHCCTTCGKLFLKADHLKRHERIHTSERPFTCEKCGKNFRDKDHLKRHHLSHSNDRPYFCEICGKQFKDKSTLVSHQKCHSSTAIACEICRKLFKTQERLEVHKAKHAEAKPHVCEVCGKKFPFHGRLRKHMLSHTGARPFHCETCGKQFRDSHSLRLHQKKHTGIGLHPCSICGKEFTNPFHLRRHERVHTGEKPFQCEVCKKTFTRLDNLDAHKRSCVVKQSFSLAVSNTSWNLPDILDSKDHTEQMTSDTASASLILTQQSQANLHCISKINITENPIPQHLTDPDPVVNSSVLPQTFSDPAVNHHAQLATVQRFDQLTPEDSGHHSASLHNAQLLNFDVNAAVNSFIGFGSNI
ncbi:uncharacterized protein LOC143448980 isoform X2 [Clavelina lepadiformis]|uniref:uncharacterized protein LOC143448980 isoform X2 n=1 Tax=Clavelina lepadiformis TaxID=159417 RepID=UPI00404343A8